MSGQEIETWRIRTGIDGRASGMALHFCHHSFVHLDHVLLADYAGGARQSESGVFRLIEASSVELHRKYDYDAK